MYHRIIRIFSVLVCQIFFGVLIQSVGQEITIQIPNSFRM